MTSKLRNKALMFLLVGTSLIGIQSLAQETMTAEEIT